MPETVQRNTTVFNKNGTIRNWQISLKARKHIIPDTDFVLTGTNLILSMQILSLSTLAILKPTELKLKLILDRNGRTIKNQQINPLLPQRPMPVRTSLLLTPSKSRRSSSHMQANTKTISRSSIPSFRKPNAVKN